MRISEAGLNLIAEFEGYSGELYNDPVGHCTIGIGHLVHYGVCHRGDTVEGPYRDGLSYSEAVHLLQQDVRRYEDAVNRLITVQLNQNQFDALVSFTFNLGYGALEGSTLRGVLNSGRHDLVCRELRRWNKAELNGVMVELAGLTRRRTAECTLWETPVVPSEGNDLLTREYDELKREIRRERHRTNWLLEAIIDLRGAVKFASTIIMELVKRTGGPGVQ